MAQWRGLRVRGLAFLSHVRMLEDVQPFSVSGHQAVLDAVMDHLHEVSRSCRTAVQISVFSGAVPPLPAGGGRRRAAAGSKRAEYGIKTLDRRFRTTNHQAVATL